jgi:hypothetical protein
MLSMSLVLKSPAHPPTIGDEPMTQVERNRRYRAKKKAELVNKQP